MTFAPITDQQREALRALMDRHGHSWRRALYIAWERASAPPVLQQLRNTHGPQWLDCVRRRNID